MVGISGVSAGPCRLSARDRGPRPSSNLFWAIRPRILLRGVLQTREGFIRGQRTFPTDPRRAQRRLRPDTAVAQASIAASRSVTIVPSRGGHFRVIGRVDGRRIDFMVNTGALVIALKPEDAAMLGIRPPERDYVAPVKTANGVMRVARSNSARSRSRILNCIMSQRWCCRPALCPKPCSECRS